MKPETKKYNCSQQDLYSALNTLWDNYLEDLADFAAYKASHNAAKRTAAKAAIKAAKDLPDEQARTGIAEQLRIKVVQKADAVIGYFVMTKGYINGVFVEEFRKANYEMAGQGYYRKATNDDWESVSGMGTSMNNYLSTNSVLLEDGGNNMPEGFPATVAAAVTAFETEYAGFKLASESGVQTAAKIKANNEIYTICREMLDDAQIIYRKEPAKAERYIFDRMLQMINPSVAGMKGTILNGNTNIGEPGAEVKMQKEGKPAIIMISDADGNYEQTGIESGDWTVTITKPDFQTVTEIIPIRPGTVSRRDFPLQPNP